MPKTEKKPDSKWTHEEAIADFKAQYEELKQHDASLVPNFTNWPSTCEIAKRVEPVGYLVKARLTKIHKRYSYSGGFYQIKFYCHSLHRTELLTKTITLDAKRLADKVATHMQVIVDALDAQDEAKEQKEIAKNALMKRVGVEWPNVALSSAGIDYGVTLHISSDINIKALNQAPSDRLAYHVEVVRHLTKEEVDAILAIVRNPDNV